MFKNIQVLNIARNWVVDPQAIELALVTARFVECGATQEKEKCSNCQFELAAGAKFCPECGTKTEAA